MKLLSYKNGGKEQLGLLVEGKVYAMQTLHPGLPSTMEGFLENWETNYRLALSAARALVTGMLMRESFAPEELRLLAPVPHPPSCRDGYAFRRHVEAARSGRGLGMIPEFDEYPVFYYTHPGSITGPGPVLCMPDHFEELDFELEVAVVIGRRGRNIPAEYADEYLAGLMILNDFSARRLQREEMLLQLGPAKGKDFATATGPWLVTKEELEHLVIPPKPGHTGLNWNLNMYAFVNGRPVGGGNLGDMDWTFAELIERASYGVSLQPGDLIGSGTVGGGCFLELNGSGKRKDPGNPPQWLQPGDTVTLRVDGLGELENTLIHEISKYSLLAKKHLKILPGIFNG